MRKAFFEPHASIQIEGEAMPYRPSEYPFPQEETALTKWCSRAAYVMLAVMLWTGFTALPGSPLSTWRVMNILFVGVCFPFYKNILLLREIKILMVFQVIILGGLLLKAVVFPYESGRLTVELSQVIAVAFAFAMAPAVASLWIYNQKNVMKAVTVSILICIGYQLFQLLTYYGLGRDEFWPTLLIDTKLALGMSNFFRIVGGFYGASGFMYESGHLALLIGPQLCLLLIVWHYGRVINRRPALIAAIMIWSMLMTLSMGGFMQIGFVVATYVAMVYAPTDLLVRFFKICFFLVGVTIVLYLVNPVFVSSIFEHVGERIVDMIAGTSTRQISGSELMWEMFWDRPLTGFGLSLTFDELGADPNVLIPLTYVTHGGLLATLVFAMYFIPMIRVFFVYKKPLFLIPMLGLGIHAAMAYGTYRWPSLWVTFTLCLCYASTFWMAPRQGPFIAMREVEPPSRPPVPNVPDPQSEPNEAKRFEKH